MRSHPEQTTSPPLMVRASRAPGRAAEGRRARSRHSRRLSSAQRREPSSPCRAPRTDWADRLHGAWVLRVRVSPLQAHEPEQNASRGSGLAGLLSVLPPRLQTCRLASCLSSARTQRDSAPTRSLALRPLGTRPPQSAFRNRHSAVHAHIHTHTQCPARCPLPLARPPSVSVRPERSSFPLLGGGWVTSRHSGNAEERGSREPPTGSGRGAGPGSQREPQGWRRSAGRL